jgi:hypothetical protein
VAADFARVGEEWSECGSGEEEASAPVGAAAEVGWRPAPVGAVAKVVAAKVVAAKAVAAKAVAARVQAGVGAEVRAVAEGDAGAAADVVSGWDRADGACAPRAVRRLITHPVSRARIRSVRSAVRR